MKFGRLAFVLTGSSIGVSATELGPLWRGALGYVLRAQSCIFTTNTPCASCSQVFQCGYGSLYEPHAPPERGFDAHQGTPAPIALYVSTPAQAMLVVEYTVLESALAALAPLVESVLRLSLRAEGLGPRRVKLKLTDLIWEPCVGRPNSRLKLNPTAPLWFAPLQAAEIPSCPNSVRLRTLSPLRFTHEGKSIRRINVADFLTRLLRRIRLLAQLQGTAPPCSEVEKACALVQETYNALQFEDFQRGSSRQQRAVPMGGLVGHVDFEIRETAHALWPWLWLGQFLQAGQGTSLGFGRYLLEPQS